MNRQTQIPAALICGTYAGRITWYDESDPQAPGKAPKAKEFAIGHEPVMGSQRVLVSVLGSVGLLVGTALYHQAGSPVSQSLSDCSAIARATDSVYPLKGRLTCAPEVVPYPSSEPFTSPTLATIGRKLEESLEQSHSPQMLADLAAVEAIEGKVSQAIEKLEQVVLLEPENPHFLNDLAALRLARFSTEKQPYDLVRGLEAADSAVEIAPDLPEARLNLSYILEELGLLRQAAAEWNEFIKLDESPAWTDEAQARLRNLKLRYAHWGKEEAAAVSPEGEVIRSRRSARLRAEKSLVVAWAQAEEAGRKEEAKKIVVEIERIGAALVSSGGDFIIRDAARRIDHVGQDAGEQALLPSLVAGHLAYARGLQQFEQDQINAARVSFRQAAENLASAKSPFFYLAVFRESVCDHYLGLYDQSISDLEHLLERIPDTYPALRGQILWMMGLARLKLGNFEGSLLDYRQSRLYFEQGREPESQAMVDMLIAENLRMQGDMVESWRYRYDALRGTLQHQLVQFLHNTLFDSAEQSLRIGYCRAALRFQNEMVSLALMNKDPVLISEALIKRSRTHGCLGRLERAWGDLSIASGWISAIAPDRQPAQRAELDTAFGELLVQREPAAAIRHLSEALEFYRSEARQFRLPSLYYRRAEAHQTVGRKREAQIDYEAAIRAHEESRRFLRGEEQRVIYFDQARDLFESVISFHVENGRPDLALAYAERFKGQSLLGSFESHRGSEGTIHIWESVPEIQARLASGVAVAAYMVLEDRILLWVLSHEGARVFSIPVNALELKAHVSRLRVLLSLEGARQEAMELAGDLYEQLISPIVRAMPGSTLVIVPDQILHALPFSMLVDRAANSYLIEQKRLIISPSISVYLASLARDEQRRRSAPMRALLVGNPALRGPLAERLANLPEAGLEVQSIAALYGDRALSLTGEDATEKKLVEESSNYEIIHLASHALLNHGSPWFSALVLASQGSLASEDGLVRADEIQRLRLDRTRLVVLSSCDSSSGQISASEGSISLSRAFLVAGVPSVVGSLWPISDYSSRIFFYRFHSFLRAGEDPAEALRKAQASCARDQDTSVSSPAVWAGFELIGGVSSN